jgi:Pentapeptide repeats (8 copies)
MHQRTVVKKYLDMKDETRISNLESKEVKENENYDLMVRSILRNFKDDSELWYFLAKNFDTLNGIKEWKIYRQATEVSSEPLMVGREKTGKEALNLLRKGLVNEFNLLQTKQNPLIDMYGLNLSGMVLANVDLSNLTIANANFSDSDISEANLSGARIQEKKKA